MEAVRPLREKHRPVRVILREYLNEILRDEREINLAEVTKATRARFASDEEFREALLDDALAILVAQELRYVAHLNRSRADADAEPTVLVRTDAGFVRQDRVEFRGKELASRIFESVGDGQRKCLLALNRPEIRAGIAMRDRMIGGLSRFNSFMRELDAGLRDDTETVDERYTGEEYERIWRRYFDREPDRDQLRLAAT